MKECQAKRHLSQRWVEDTSMLSDTSAWQSQSWWCLCTGSVVYTQVAIAKIYRNQNIQIARGSILPRFLTRASIVCSTSESMVLFVAALRTRCETKDIAKWRTH